MASVGAGLNCACGLVHTNIAIVDELIAMNELDSRLDSAMEKSMGHSDVSDECALILTERCNANCEKQCDQGCIECNGLICVDCFKIHERGKIFEGHHMLPKLEFRKHQQTEAKTRPSKCKKHPHKEVEFYCTQCRALACSSCGMLEHLRSGHTMVSLEEGADMERSSITDLRRDVLSRASALETQLAHIRKTRTDFERRIHGSHSYITQVVDELKAQIELKGQQAHSEVNKLTEGPLRALEADDKAATCLIARVNKSIELTEKTLQQEFSPSIFDCFSLLHRSVASAITNETEHSDGGGSMALAAGHCGIREVQNDVRGEASSGAAATTAIMVLEKKCDLEVHTSHSIVDVRAAIDKGLFQVGWGEGRGTEVGCTSFRTEGGGEESAPTADVPTSPWRLRPRSPVVYYPPTESDDDDHEEEEARSQSRRRKRRKKGAGKESRNRSAKPSKSTHSSDYDDEQEDRWRSRSRSSSSCGSYFSRCSGRSTSPSHTSTRSSTQPMDTLTAKW